MKALLYKISAILVAYGPWGIFLLSVVDSVGIPLPAAMDVLLIGLAAGSVKTPQHAFFAALMAVIGSTGGNFALFSAANQIFRERALEAFLRSAHIPPVTFKGPVGPKKVEILQQSHAVPM